MESRLFSSDTKTSAAMRCPFSQPHPLVLASASPRRQDFLREQGLKFVILPATAPEVRPEAGEEPEAYALRTAKSKAAASRAELLGKTPLISGTPAPLVLSADTIVVLDGDILGKPADAADATAMLERMKGRCHTVITACCLWFADEDTPCKIFADKASVRFADWPRELLEAYVATGEPLDKAGAYGIQGLGAFLAEHIEGSWSTVVGLPLSRVIQALLECGALRSRRA